MDWLVLLVALGIVLAVVFGCALAFIVYVMRVVLRGHRRIEQRAAEIEKRAAARRSRIKRAVGERVG